MLALSSLALLTALLGQTETWSARGAVHLTLHPMTALTTPSNATVTVDARHVTAPHGVRRSSATQPFTGSTALVLGEDFTVRCASGHFHHVSVTAVKLGFVTVVVTQQEERGAENDATGSYAVSEVQVGGLPAQPFGERLVLELNGTFRWGQVRGGWVLVDGAVYLLGGRSDWGPAVMNAAARELVFEFRRGPVPWKVRLTRT